MKYFKVYLMFLLTIIITSIIIGTLSFHYLVKEQTAFIIQNIILFIILFIHSYKLGMIKHKNGYLEGIKFGGLIDFLFIVLGIVIKENFNFYKVIYYMLIILTSVVGSILGVNKKTKG